NDAPQRGRFRTAHVNAEYSTIPLRCPGLHLYWQQGLTLGVVMPENVFVSYARADGEDFAKKLHDHLEANGFMTWLDRRDIKLGENWDLSIDKAIRECWALLFVMTPSGVESPNCHDEWSRALSFKKPVLPLLVKPSVPPM